jgi:hypothetical protein
MSHTRAFAPGDLLLPALWIFQVAEIPGDPSFWICAKDDQVARTTLRDRHRRKGIQSDPRTRPMEVLSVRPAVPEYVYTPTRDGQMLEEARCRTCHWHGPPGGFAAHPCKRSK